MTQRRLSIDHLVVAGVDPPGLRPDRLEALLTRELARRAAAASPREANAMARVIAQAVRDAVRRGQT